jgi:uncharacterized protein (TIGR00369 family)
MENSDETSREPSIFDRFDVPPAAKLLGRNLRAIDPDTGTIEVGFTADDRFMNPGGTVQGGIPATMLDDAQGPALFGATPGRIYAPTINFNVSFLKPAKPGKFIGEGRVLNIGRSIAFTEAELFDEDGDLVARGAFTNRDGRRPRAEG